MSIAITSPGALLVIAVTRSSRDFNTCPLIVEMTSPSRRPISAAGEPLTGAYTMRTLPVSPKRPAAAYTPINKVNAITICMSEPAVMTNNRRGYDFERYERSSSAGSQSSKLLMPMMRTKAPSGMARTPYSSSPRFLLHRRGPKPI